MLEFTENLERVLLLAYNATKGGSSVEPQQTASNPSADQLAVQEGEVAEMKMKEDLLRREFVYSVPELI